MLRNILPPSPPPFNNIPAFDKCFPIQAKSVGDMQNHFRNAVPGKFVRRIDYSLFNLAHYTTLCSIPARIFFKKRLYVDHVHEVIAPAFLFVKQPDDFHRDTVFGNILLDQLKYQPPVFETYKCR